MLGEKHRTWDGTIVLVADPGARTSSGDYDRAIDRPKVETVDELKAALEACCGRLVHIADLGEFTDRAGRHLRSLVFPYWFGESSRSRHGLVPAICEANGMMFVGADAFAKIVCNDKELSKAVCRQAGLQVPQSGVVRTLDELQFVRNIALPIIVKPNFEGTSLGISDRNLCHSWEEVFAIASELLSSLGQALVIEHFVTGREFSACLMRTGAGVQVRSGSWSIGGDEAFLDNRVFSAALKTGDEHDMTFQPSTETLDDATQASMRDCFDRLGKVDLLRIDGRLKDGRCTVIELTPDIFLGADGEFATLYKPNNSGYAGFVADIVRNCIEGYGTQLPV